MADVNIQVLGCSGGVGGIARTTSFLIDQHILIDAGTGVMNLELDRLARIDHVFITHAHLDHIASLPLLLDSVTAMRKQPLQVYAQEATITALKKHIFNWQIWPDFSQIPDPENPYLKFNSLALEQPFALGEIKIKPVAVEHTVPAVGYIVSGNNGSFAFSGDMTENDHFWEALNNCPDLTHLVVETTFPDEQIELTKLSKHLCPSMLASELGKLKLKPAVYITHLMPGGEEGIMAEIKNHLPNENIQQLKINHCFRL